ncbi:MAG TPA: ferredoxin [Methanocella sp.]|nr:ferredoxin [Methanocella sp.]
MVIPVIDKELCISCGNCVDICPDVFNWDVDDKAIVVDAGGCGTKCPDCQEAADSCPTNAITIQEDGASTAEGAASQ